MTVQWTDRAAEPTAAFSPQRKCKTVRFKSHLRNQKKHRHPFWGACAFLILQKGFEPIT